MIRLERFTRRYGSFTAVDAVDLQIADGLIFGLLGPNGAGKTTTVKCLTGLLRPNSGRILVEGLEVSERPLEVKRLVGYVPENPVLFKTLTARELLTLAGRLHRLEESELAPRIAELLKVFGLSEKAEEQVQSFSKGMTQKLAIAAALIHNPRVIVLDEGLSGLDAPSAAVLKRLLRSFADAGRTVLFCSHVLEVVERLCDRIAIMVEGRIRAEGTVAAILEQTRAATLEQAFIRLTGETDIAREAGDILAALDSRKS